MTPNPLPRGQLSIGKTFALIFALLLIGPVMYVVAREVSMGRAFGRIDIGDPAIDVIHRMGAPQEEATANLHTQADKEYRYFVWPMKRMWVFGVKDDKVVDKQEVERP